MRFLETYKKKENDYTIFIRIKYKEAVMVVGLKWFSVIGIFCNIIGVVVLAYGLIISKKDAIALGISRICGNTDEENLALPQVRDRLKQSRNAKIGMVLLVIGFILQIVGSWPR